MGRRRSRRLQRLEGLGLGETRGSAEDPEVLRRVGNSFWDFGAGGAGQPCPPLGFGGGGEAGEGEFGGKGRKETLTGTPKAR